METVAGRTGGRRQPAALSRGNCYSERQVVVVVDASVGSRPTIAFEDGTQIGHRVEQTFGQGGDAVGAVVTDAAGLVAEQVGVLRQDGESGEVQGVVEQFEGGELRGRDHVLQAERRPSRLRATPPARHGGHRFLPGGRLPGGAGVWNTSK